MRRYKLIREIDYCRYQDNNFIYYLYRKKLFGWEKVATEYSKAAVTALLKNLTTPPMFEGTLKQITLMWMEKYDEK